MRTARMRAWIAAHPWTQWRASPLDPILHPSPWRLRLLGAGLIIGQLLFGWIWARLLPQPYESAMLRGAMSVLGLVLMWPQLARALSNGSTQLLFTMIVWIEFPIFFSWMYLCNNGNAVWLATLCAIILIYYHLTDWRIATFGCVSGALFAWGLFSWLGPHGPSMAGTDAATSALVIAFSWCCALLLGLSSADLRRVQLSNTLTTMGIMAHELRTPLSTADLLGDAIQLEVQRQPQNPRASQLEKLALRLHALVRNMNHQIDTQIANARLLQLPRYTEQISAAQLAADVVGAYPFASTRQRECLTLQVYGDFTFTSSPTQFSQVLDNLIKNALHSLTAADSKFPPGALRIEVGKAGGRGRISVADDGMGIEDSLLPYIFKPFFSSDRGTGHGLGLAFCRQVVQSAGGTLQVKSEYAVGAVFTIELPLSGG